MVLTNEQNIRSGAYKLCCQIFRKPKIGFVISPCLSQIIISFRSSCSDRKPKQKEKLKGPFKSDFVATYVYIVNWIRDYLICPLEI